MLEVPFESISRHSCPKGWKDYIRSYTFLLLTPLEYHRSDGEHNTAIRLCS